MTDYDNNNTGALFKNNKREKDTHPTHTGSVTIDGVEYWQNAWTKKTKTGDTFLSQSFKRKEERAKPAPQPVNDSIDPFADDMPF